MKDVIDAMFNSKANLFNSLTKEFDDFNDFFFGKDFSLPNFFSDGYNRMRGWKSKFPFYNTKILSKDEFQIEIALAGYDKNDISIHEDKEILTVATCYQESNYDIETKAKKETPTVSDEINYNPNNYPVYLHRGLTQKSFSVSFKLPDRFEILKPKFENGILTINIKSFERTENPPRRIDIE